MYLSPMKVIALNNSMFPKRKPVEVGKPVYGEGLSLKSMDERLRVLEEALMPLLHYTGFSRICGAECCEKRHFANGWCNTHNAQFHKHRIRNDGTEFVPKPIKPYRLKKDELT